MYTRNYHPLRSLLVALRMQLIWYIPYVTAVYVAYHYIGIEALDIKMSIATVLGFAVALLLAFRTSASYDRWWEARKIWGGIVNDSRTLIRQVLEFTDQDKSYQQVEKLTKLMIAWCYCLKNSLRGTEPLEELDHYLDKSELDSLKIHSNKPNEILKRMSDIVRDLKNSGQIDTYQMVALDQTLKQLCDHMGKCERINNTVFPIQYRSYTRTGILIFTLMLPYGMLLSTGPFVILICTLVAFIFNMLDQIAVYLQDPFMNKPSDIPMTALSRTIEINLLEMIGAQDIPNPVKPDNKGILM